jgi:hypothetical protein
MVKRDGLLGPIKECLGGGLRYIDLPAFAFSLARCELHRATAEDHETVLHFGEPIILVVALLGVCCFLLGIILGLTVAGEVAPHHGALF